MTDNDKKAPDYGRIDISGDIKGQASFGNQNTLIQTNLTPGPGLTEAELAELRLVLSGLKDQVAAEAPLEKKDAALEKVGELEQAITAKEPKLSTMEYIRDWFGENLPGLAGAITSLLLSPLVGKAVEAAGGVALAEYRRRF